MPSTMPLRVGDDLLASAKLAADAAGRSAAQQIGYWAKLGRELERSRSVSVREIAEVLAGARSYDDLDPQAQASVRGEWEARIEARRAALNLAERFTADGRSWVELGPDSTTVRHRTAGDGGKPERRQRGAASVTSDGRSRLTSRTTGKDASGRRSQSARGVPAAAKTKRASTSKAIATNPPVKKAAAKTKASANSR